MKIFAPLLILCSNTFAQSLPNFAAKCDSDVGKYLILVSEANLINLLEKPTKSGPFAWRGDTARTENNYYKFSVVSDSSSVMKCSLHRKEGTLNCENSSISYTCVSADYRSALNDYKNIQKK